MLKETVRKHHNFRVKEQILKKKKERKKGKKERKMVVI